MVKVVNFAVNSGVKEEHVSEGILDNNVVCRQKLKASDIILASKGCKFLYKPDGEMQCHSVI